MSRQSRRKKYIAGHDKRGAQHSRKPLIIALTIVAVAAIGIAVALLIQNGSKGGVMDIFSRKAELLRAEVLGAANELGDAPVGSAGYAVFLSVSDGTERARVFTGVGASLDAAWQSACDKTESYVREHSYSAKWMKADAVKSSQTITADELASSLSLYQEQYFRMGLSLDSGFKNAFLEEELNCAKIYDYENYRLNTENLNNYLERADRSPLTDAGSDYTVFSCVAWFCGEDESVCRLSGGKYDYGRRDIENVDSGFVNELLLDSTAYLEEQLNEDGSFIYGYKPRFDNEIDGYNILRHAGSIWTLVLRYQMTGDKTLLPKIERAIDYVIDTSVKYSDADTAYVLDADSDEIKLGGNGIFIVSLTEYMDAAGSDKYADIAAKLGNGILTMLDGDTGVYTHVLNPDFTVKEEYRTVYYDGEATFALCRLYGMTKDAKWLTAAESAVDHFIAADYTKYRDHWVAYSLNELTMYVKDERYFTFALQNAQENLKKINSLDRCSPTCLELLMAAFETYDRIQREGIQVDYLEQGFDLEYFLQTIYNRADAELDSYFFPEYAMYMRNPQRILYAFMAREDEFRTRIDDTQHSVGGYYLYAKYYDKLVQYGMSAGGSNA